MGARFGVVLLWHDLKGGKVPGLSWSLYGLKASTRLALSAFVGMVSLGIAIIGAFLLRQSTGINEVNIFVETLAGRSGDYFGGLGLFAPLGFAFAAGVAAAFNPCGFAMLPAYIGLYLGGKENNQSDRNPVRQLGRAIIVGGSVTAGFVLLFGIAGLIIGVGARSVVSNVMPWMGLGIGVGLSSVGAWLICGGALYTGSAQRVASRIGNPVDNKVRGYFLFGISYGIASLSCTLPIFLAVIGTSFASYNMATSFSQFVLYALGMGIIIISVTVGMALFKGAMIGTFRKVIPFVAPVGSWMMMLAGTYIVFYWLTVGGLMPKL